MKKNILIITTVLIIYGLNKFDCIYFSNETIQYFINCYLNDILCGTLFISYCNILLERNDKKINTLLNIEVLLFLCGIFWEYIAPMFISYSISDPYDIVAYMLGGLVYWLLNINNKNTLR